MPTALRFVSPDPEIYFLLSACLTKQCPLTLLHIDEEICLIFGWIYRSVALETFCVQQELRSGNINKMKARRRGKHQ